LSDAPAMPHLARSEWHTTGYRLLQSRAFQDAGRTMRPM
jgi:hypothetical protein